jgi:hypothetical protein
VERQPGVVIEFWWSVALRVVVPGIAAVPDDDPVGILFTLVINAGTGVQDLTVGQIHQIHAGKVTNWEDLGGNDQPVRLGSRNPGSGTRAAFQRQVLNGVREPGSDSDDCRNRDPGSPPGVVRPCGDLANPQLCHPS